MTDYIIKGRCEDGTVYWDGHGWTNTTQYARRLILLAELAEPDKMVSAEAVLEGIVQDQKGKDIHTRVYQLRLVKAPRKRFGFYRKEKRYWRQNEASVAYDRGQDSMMWGGPHRQRNPYPPGRRHDEFERGKRTADPMGEYHGRNV